MSYNQETLSADEINEEVHDISMKLFDTLQENKVPLQLGACAAFHASLNTLWQLFSLVDHLEDKPDLPEDVEFGLLEYLELTVSTMESHIGHARGNLTRIQRQGSVIFASGAEVRRDN
jgi:hypothetical protein